MNTHQGDGILLGISGGCFGGLRRVLDVVFEFSGERTRGGLPAAFFFANPVEKFTEVGTLLLGLCVGG
ncbi:MAG: hypothetical protein CMF28_04320 [Kiritimatiellaceae bacterium]|nr:hypothetical protein [Kiritimatiellaceae bacterium]